MSHYVIKLAITVIAIMVASELAKHRTLLGALVVSLPLVSYLSIIWLYAETRDAQRVAAFSWDVLLLVIPSLTLFIALPLLLRKLSFVPSLLLGTLVMFLCYGCTMWLVGALSRGVDT